LFFKDSVHTFTYRLFGYLLAIVIQILIARFLGAAPKGELQIVMFLLALVGVVSGLGYERAIIYNIGNNKYPLKSIWSNALSFLSLSILASFAVLLPIFYLIRPVFGDISFVLIILIFIVVPFDRFFSCQLGVFNGQGHLSKGNIFAFWRSIFYVLLVTFFVVWILPKSTGIVYAYGIAFLLTNIIVSVYFFKHYALSISFAFDLKQIKESISYGVKGQIGNISNLIATRLSLLIMNYHLGKSAAGVYSVALNFSDLLVFLPFIITYVIFPHTARRKEEEGWLLTQRVTRVSFASSIVFAIIVAVLAPIFIPLLFGSDFSGAILPLFILLPGVVLLAAFRIMASGISGLGYPQYYSICTVFMVVVALVLNLLLVPKYQGMGAALASSISYCIAFLVMVMIIKFKFSLSLRDFLLLTREDYDIINNYLKKYFKHEV
jgi:O-antigen/teichoic acid export membrane protein